MLATRKVGGGTATPTGAVMLRVSVTLPAASMHACAAVYSGHRPAAAMPATAAPMVAQFLRSAIVYDAGKGLVGRKARRIAWERV